MLRVADLGLLLFHAALTLLNLFGWAWWRTRTANLVALTATGLSWFGLGIWYGFGYCPLTDWHWQVLRRLGVEDLPRSYITYLLQRILGLSVSGSAVVTWTVVLYFAALAISLFLNGRKWLRRRKGGGAAPYPSSENAT